MPGGTASYPSSVLMNAVPAKVAGVPRIVMVVPTPRGELNPLVLAAARLAGVDEIYRVGGAQAVAALAYGTATHRAGRQDRRPRQRLCGGRQAPRLRPGRHRHDRRPVRGAGPRRRQRQSRLDRRRSPGPGRARRGRAVDPRHRRARRSPTRSRRRSRRQLATLPRAAIAGASWRDFGADHPGAGPRRRGAAGRPAGARASRDRGRATPRRSPRRSAMPARSSSAATRRRRSATMSAARTTSCRRRARRASRPASACSTS